MSKRCVQIWKLGATGARCAFTLVEILIVVAILGILAAVIVPEYKNYSQKAKESAAKENLQMLQTAIERYAVSHNGVPPGYPDNNPSLQPNQEVFLSQMTGPNKYLHEIPENPFNHLNTVAIILNDAAFRPSPDGTRGWVYKPQTKRIRVASPGVDSQGVKYYDY
jgi:general secretion pathway protein G